jgi:hypothetical protein
MTTPRKKPGVVNHVKRHPAEYGAVGIWGAVVGVLTAFGVDEEKAMAIAGLAATAAPGILTWARLRGWI